MGRSGAIHSVPNIVDVVKEEAKPFLGDTSALSRDEVIARVRDLAASEPDTARRMVTTVCEAIDDQTGGQYSGQLGRLEEMVAGKLGVQMVRMRRRG